jgi:hypothetical protein
MPNSAAQVQVRGSKELRKTLKAAGDDLSELKDVHEAVGALVARVAKSLAPVRSGQLAGSVRAARLAGGVSVRAGSARVPYSNPIHWGWPKRNIAANPFISNAALQTEPQWVALYEAELEKIIQKVEGDK